MNCSDLFYNKQSESGTLHSRITLSQNILDKGIAKKDALIRYLRPELEGAFDTDVKFWLQGSRKSFTLIAPLDRNSTYDIDVGIYILSDYDEPIDEAKDVKDILKQTLQFYCKTDKEAKIQGSKNACEGLEFNNFLTIDTPIYFMSNKAGATPLLATDNGWIDSDPRAIQNWLTNAFSEDSERALMKRVVRYFKAWVNVKWNGFEHKKFPSLALNILVANNLHIGHCEVNSFEGTVSKICSSLSESFTVHNPLNGQDILGMSDEAKLFAKKQFDNLNNVYLKIKDEDDSTKALEYSSIFEHYFPQVPVLSQHGSSSVPVLSKVPEIYVERYDSSGQYISGEITSEIEVRKGESLTFRIHNKQDFSASDEVYWTVRNEGDQSLDANDIGHIRKTTINESSHRGTSYTGTHSMECMIKSWATITGISLVKVRVRPVAQIQQKRKFKGFTKFGKRR
ncbi:AGS_C domain-containing protein [Vibrio chagasii]|nr:AGS_C domain-containing protein [Vibrio chagasii]